MSKNIVLPADQEKRIRVLRFMSLLIIPMALLTHPVLGGYTGEVLEQIGMILIVLGVIGRFWATLYIGGHKNKDVITDGPYSICRHPLYLFSSIAVLGFRYHAAKPVVCPGHGLSRFPGTKQNRSKGRGVSEIQIRWCL